MKISIVTTLYHSENYINEFCTRIINSAKQIFNDIEIILVHDESPDNSLAEAIEIAKKDNRIKIIDLSRNFGQHKALMTGLMHASGDYVFMLDSDLEEKPELLEIFFEKMKQNPRYDVVYGIQISRRGNIIERVSGTLFYKLFNLFSNVKIPKNQITARLMTARYVKALIEHKDKEIFLAGLWAITGFKQLGIAVKKENNSPTTYNIGKKIALLISSITSFTSKPLMVTSYLGVAITLISLSFILHLVYKKIFHGIQLQGWTSLFVSMWFIGGLIILFIGIIGLYISRMFNETKNRPYTTVKEIYSFTKSNNATDIKKAVNKYYTELVNKHGSTPAGVDWNSTESQTKRFEQLLKVADNKKFSINELGCGYGALIDYLKKQNFIFQYAGYDISSAMITQAKKRYSQFKNVKFSNSLKMQKSDFTVASGIFNVKLHFDDTQWEMYCLSVLDDMNNASLKGFSFNMLSKYSDASLMKDNLFYADPLKVFDYCKKNFSKNVALLHDYELYEFTVVVRK